MKALSSILAVVALLASGLVSARDAVADPPRPRRIAVVVGANAAAAGRHPLRFAQDDARAVARALRDVAGFAGADVRVLLDPEPAAVLSALDRALAELARAPGESLLLFHYSGHADAQSLYPSGRALAFADLRARLDREGPSVRIGVIDTCRGGGWTGTRGLEETAPFEVDVPFDLTSEGSVLIASSSGLEDAHESETIGGGFFTHHWNAALRGAADANGDRVVSLGEAFEYAKRLTIRDSALVATTPQHPSFRMNLRGRQDLPLARLAAGPSVLAVDQQRGPIQLVHLESGLVVLEAPPGRRALRLSVPPGRYLVRVRAERGPLRAREVVVRSNATTTVREDQLELVGDGRLAVRGGTPHRATLTTLPGRHVDTQFAFGVRHGQSGPGIDVELDEGTSLAALFQASYGITDRLQWQIGTLAFAYRLGDPGQVEWIPWGGLDGWGIGGGSNRSVFFLGSLGVGLDARIWLGGGPGSLVAGLSGSSGFNSDAEQGYGPETWRARASFGWTRTIADTVTFGLGAAWSQNLLHEGGAPSNRAESAMRLSLGSVNRLGMRPIPLVRVHLSPVVSFDLHASLDWSLATNDLAETYMAGWTFTW